MKVAAVLLAVAMITYISVPLSMICDRIYSKARERNIDKKREMYRSQGKFVRGITSDYPIINFEEYALYGISIGALLLSLAVIAAILFLNL